MTDESQYDRELPRELDEAQARIGELEAALAKSCADNRADSEAWPCPLERQRDEARRMLTDAMADIDEHGCGWMIPHECKAAVESWRGDQR